MTKADPFGLPIFKSPILHLSSEWGEPWRLAGKTAKAWIF